MRLLTCQFTDPGGRSPNEDSIGYFTKGTVSAWIAADGLGGHTRGEVASAEAVQTLNDIISECDSLNSTFVEDAFRLMNENILALHGPLTTAVSAFSDGKKLWYANSGDSRFLFIRDKMILCHTNDHSLAYVSYSAGQITYEEISTHPAQNRLFHSLGNEVEFTGEFYPALDLQPGDAFVLCTDGFWELINNDEIVRTLNISLSPQEWLSMMLDIVQSRLKKNSDNYSAVCVMVKAD